MRAAADDYPQRSARCAGLHRRSRNRHDSYLYAVYILRQTEHSPGERPLSDADGHTGRAAAVVPDIPAGFRVREPDTGRDTRPSHLRLPAYAADGYSAGTASSAGRGTAARHAPGKRHGAIGDLAPGTMGAAIAAGRATARTKRPVASFDAARHPADHTASRSQLWTWGWRPTERAHSLVPQR